MNKLDQMSRGPTVRVLGGRSPAPVVSVLWPVAAKLVLVLLAALVLAMIGLRAGASRAGALVPPTDAIGSAGEGATGEGVQREGVQRAGMSGEERRAEGALRSRVDAGATSPEAPSDGGAGPGTLSDGRVVLNLADVDDLVRLPGIGPTRAAAILALRRRLGRFRSIDDLVRVKGIGKKTLRRIRPNVVLDAPAARSAEKDAG
jgi:competence protein ComEA